MPKYSIEEIIRQAMQEGKFDDLPGKGKPLNLDQNPHQDPEWRVAHHLLKSAGFSLPWIERLDGINEKLNQARTALARSWEWQGGEHGDSSEEAQWSAAMELFAEQVDAINDQIRAYNLEVPNSRFQVPLVNIDQELEYLTNQGDS